MSRIKSILTGSRSMIIPKAKNSIAYSTKTVPNSSKVTRYQFPSLSLSSSLLPLLYPPARSFLLSVAYEELKPGIG
jgi:hypothetical protein